MKPTDLATQAQKALTYYAERKCPHCHTEISIRNKTGYCDHLYYPESCAVCKRLKLVGDGGVWVSCP